MSLRNWLQMFVTAGALAWSVEIATPHSAQAQQPMPPTPSGQNVPVLPETEVVVDPPTQQANNAPPMQLGAADDILTGNLFTNPPITGYHAGSSSVGSIIAIPDIRMPGSINTISQDLRHDQQALRISDILRDIGGAVQTNNDNLRPDSFLLRGLDMTSYNFRKNGFQDPTYTPRDFANVDRIDVFKGPASVLYGAAQPAGTLNVVTKKPVFDRFAFGSMTYGSFGLQRYTADVNGVGPNENLLVRVNAAWEEGNTFRNFSYQERVFISPSVTFVLTPDTIINFEGEYLHDERRRDSGIIAVNGNPRILPQDRFFGSLDDYASWHDYRATLSLTHQFNDSWNFYLGGTTLFYDAPSRSTIPQTGFVTTLTPEGFFANVPGNTVNRSQNQATNFAEQNHALISYVAGIFDTGPFTHNTVLGVEMDWQVVNLDTFDSSIAGLDPALTINPFSSDPYPGGVISQSFSFNNPGFRNNRYGIFTSDLLEVTDRLKLMGGLRYDWVDQSYNRQLLFGGFPIFAASTDDSFQRLSGRAGALYELVPGAASLYTVFAQSFNPPGGGNYGNAPVSLKPELGNIIEGGMKVNIFDDFTLTMAGFYIDRSNVTTNVAGNLLAQVNGQKSRGFEMNLVGQITDRLSTVSNYAYTDVNQDSPGLSGRVRGVPFHTANMWARYNVIQDQDRVLGLGLGTVYVGDRRGDYATPLTLPSYNRWDAGVFGRLGRWDLATYIENVFDIRYETGSINQYQVYPGAPVNFRLTLGATF